MNAQNSRVAVDGFVFNPEAFAKACVSLSGADQTITRNVGEAHRLGKSALCELIGALATLKVPLTDTVANVIRVASFRARKAHNSEFTLSVSKQGKGYSFALAKTSDITRAAGAGRKPAKPSEPSIAERIQSATEKAHAQRAAATESAKLAVSRADRLASALRTLGFDDSMLARIANGTMKNAELRRIALAALSPSLPATRQPRARKSA